MSYRSVKEFSSNKWYVTIVFSVLFLFHMFRLY